MALFAKGRAEVFAALDGLNRAQKLLIDAGEFYLANQLNKAEWQVLVVAAETTDAFNDRRREPDRETTPDGRV